MVEWRYAIHLVRAWNGSLETNRPERGRQSNAKRTLCVNACPGGGDEMEPKKERKNLTLPLSSIIAVNPAITP